MASIHFIKLCNLVLSGYISILSQQNHRTSKHSCSRNSYSFCNCDIKDRLLEPVAFSNMDECIDTGSLISLSTNTTLNSRYYYPFWLISCTSICSLYVLLVQHTSYVFITRMWVISTKQYLVVHIYCWHFMYLTILTVRHIEVYFMERK